MMLVCGYFDITCFAVLPLSSSLKKVEFQQRKLNSIIAERENQGEENMQQKFEIIMDVGQLNSQKYRSIHDYLFLAPSI